MAQFLLEEETAGEVRGLISHLIGWEPQGALLFRLDPPIVPPGWEAVGLVRDGVLYLFSYDLAAGSLRLLEGVAGAAVNDAKLWIVQEGSEVSGWSQYPFRATEQVVVYRWENGSLGGDRPIEGRPYPGCVGTTAGTDSIRSLRRG